MANSVSVNPKNELLKIIQSFYENTAVPFDDPFLKDFCHLTKDLIKEARQYKFKLDKALDSAITDESTFKNSEYDVEVGNFKSAIWKVVLEQENNQSTNNWFDNFQKIFRAFCKGAADYIVEKEKMFTVPTPSHVLVN